MHFRDISLRQPLSQLAEFWLSDRIYYIPGHFAVLLLVAIAVLASNSGFFVAYLRWSWEPSSQVVVWVVLDRPTLWPMIIQHRCQCSAFVAICAGMHIILCAVLYIECSTQTAGRLCPLAVSKITTTLNLIVWFCIFFVGILLRLTLYKLALASHACVCVSTLNSGESACFN